MKLDRERLHKHNMEQLFKLGILVYCLNTTFNCCYKISTVRNMCPIVLLCIAVRPTLEGLLLPLLLALAFT